MPIQKYHCKTFLLALVCAGIYYAINRLLLAVSVYLERPDTTFNAILFWYIRVCCVRHHIWLACQY